MKRTLFVILLFIFVLAVLSGCSSAGTPDIDTSDGAPAYDYHNGLAVIKLDSSRHISGILDEDGNTLAKFVDKSTGKIKYLNNGNIFFTAVSLDLDEPSFANTHSYMFCKSSGEFVPMPAPAYNYASKINYSDGLMIVYSNGRGEVGTKYFDGDGNCVLDLDNSNKNYLDVTWASGFDHGEAVVFFTGADKNNYRVFIDKTGKWLGDPVKKTTSRRYGDYDLAYDNPFN